MSHVAGLAQLQLELGAAYEQQLLEQAQSAERFLGTVAGFCEREACTGHALAVALQGLQKRSISTETQVDLHASPLGLPEPMSEAPKILPLPPSLPARESIHAHMPKDDCAPPPSFAGSPGRRQSLAAMCGLSPSRRRQVSPSPSLGHNSTPVLLQMDSPKSSKVEESFEGEQSPLLSPSKVSFKNEFAIAKCSFISEQSKIIKPPGELARLLGPRAMRMMQKMTPSIKSGAEKAPSKFAQVVDGKVFKFCSVFAICVNFIFIMVQTDFKMSNLHADKPFSHNMIEICFTAFYVLELSAQIAVHRKAFFLGHDMLWNCFDFVIVAVAVVEIVMAGLGHSKGGMSFLRVLRFLKVSRVFRMFNAMRIFKEIRLMVDSLMGSFVFFVWCACMLGLFLSLFAIFFVQGMTTMLEERKDLDETLRQAILQDFGSVSGAMLSLLMAVTGGNDWGEFHPIIKELGPVYNFLYLFFILFSSIAFFNVVTSVFCEKAMHLARPSMDDIMADMKSKEVQDASVLLSMLDSILQDDDDDDTRALDCNKFEEFLSYPQVVAYFELRGLNESSVRRFFRQLLEIHQTRSIDFGTFASACVKLHGTASNVDVHMLSAEIKSIKLSQLRLQRCLTEKGPPMVRETHSLQASPPVLFSASPCRAHAPPHTKRVGTENRMLKFSPLPSAKAMLSAVFSPPPPSDASHCRPQVPEVVTRSPTCPALHWAKPHREVVRNPSIDGGHKCTALHGAKSRSKVVTTPNGVDGGEIKLSSGHDDNFSCGDVEDVSPGPATKMVPPVDQQTGPLKGHTHV